MRQNLHTHSTWCDGRNTTREMAEAAVEKGFDILGFSGHASVPSWDGSMSVDDTRAYVQEVLSLKEEYKDRLSIYLGIEEDTENRLLFKEPFEFVIGSCHSLAHEGVRLAVDYNRGISEFMLENWYHNDYRAFVREYFREVLRMKDWDEVDIIGHIDLITKFNEDESFFRFDDPFYVKEATDAIDAFAGRKILEVNTGAIARGYRTTPYPARNLLQYMKEKNVRILLSSDCHTAGDLDCFFPEALELIRSCGYTSMAVFDGKEFRDTDIREFR